MERILFAPGNLRSGNCPLCSARGLQYSQPLLKFRVRSCGLPELTPAALGKASCTNRAAGESRVLAVARGRRAAVPSAQGADCARRILRWAWNDRGRRSRPGFGGTRAQLVWCLLPVISHSYNRPLTISAAPIRQLYFRRMRPCYGNRIFASPQPVPDPDGPSAHGRQLSRVWFRRFPEMTFLRAWTDPIAADTRPLLSTYGELAPSRCARRRI